MSSEQFPDHIDRILKDWPYDGEALSVRRIEGPDGRDLLQIRIELGLLQLETSDRPDGTTPGGHPSYLDFLKDESQHDDMYEFDENDFIEVDREFLQYYHRRICWLRLHEYEKAMTDADHSLALMDFCREHSEDEDWILSHEQYRPFVLFHRTQAAALAALESDGPENAIGEVNLGLDRLKDFFREFSSDDLFEEDELVAQLVEVRESLRETFDVGLTLEEQLVQAVAQEQYERAALLRDKLAKRDPLH